MVWTSEQKQAIELRDESLLVAAGAGSGKTAVLVERIVELICGGNGCDIDSLLVVTFTKAAATEMRERIAARITERLNEAPSDGNLLRQMALLNRANIMTMHSFCKKVISENFHAVELDPDYHQMEESEIQMVMGEAVARVLEDSYTRGEPDFLKLSDTLGGMRDDGELEELIKTLYRFSIAGPSPLQWIKQATGTYDLGGKSLDDTQWMKQLKAEVEEAAEEALDLSERLLQMITGDPETAATKYLPFFQAEYASLKQLRAGIGADVPFDRQRQAVHGMVFERLPIVKTVPAETKESIKKLREGAKKILDDLKKTWFLEDEDYNTGLIQGMHPVLQALGRTVTEFFAVYSAMKREKNRIDYNDLEHFALQILCRISFDAEGEMIVTPTEAASNYAGRFTEILVDEYQDSNDVQETIIKAVSKGGGNIFMVGDVKQSIYRFRRAKPELFLDKYKRFALPAEAKGDGRKILLYSNFRSRAEILHGVNFLFSHLMSERAGELAYTDEEALIAQADYNYDTAIPVEISLIDPDQPMTGAGEEEGGEDLKGIELEAGLVAGKIREMVNSGEVFINDRGVGRPLKYRDIVILLRSVKNTAAYFTDALTSLSIPVYSESAAGYFQSIEIRTILALLRTIDNPRQDIPVLAVLRSPLFSFREDELIDLRVRDKKRLMIDCIRDCAGENSPLGRKCAAFLTALDQWRGEAIHLDLDEFIWKLYSDTAYYEYAGAMPNGIQRQANLKILFQRAGSYEKTAFKGLFNFIRFIDAMQEKNVDFGDAKIFGENEDVVRIMSIHKSKGLEFPVVFIANAGKMFNRMDQIKAIAIHEKLGVGVKNINIERSTRQDTLPRLVIKSALNRESLSEEMRILYVAMTRARERLIITGSHKKLPDTLEKWAAIGDTPDGRLRPYNVLKNSSYLDWMMPVILNDPELKAQREASNGEAGLTLASSKFTLEVHSREDVMENAAELAEAKREDFWGGEELKDERVLRILNYQYPHWKSVELPGKISVSVIKKQAIEENLEAKAAVHILDEQYRETEEPLPKPEFLKATKELTGAERGTAFHTVMLHISPGVSTETAADEAINCLVMREILLQEEADTVNRKKVLGFLRSDLGQRFREADLLGNLYREEVFYRAVDPAILDPAAVTNDKITMIGIIDAFFIENGEIVLLDYKTDAIPQNSVDYLKERYETQIGLYKEALEAITGKRVKEAYLYSVSREETIRML